MKPINKCKYHKYNEDNWEHICTEYGVCCKGNKIDQKKCLIAQLENKCKKYEQALDEIAAHYQKVIKNITTYDDSYDASISIEALHNISDIINKAKEIMYKV